MIIISFLYCCWYSARGRIMAIDTRKTVTLVLATKAPWLLPPLLSKSECWAPQYKPGDTSFYTKRSVTRSRLGWFPSAAVWCCFGTRRPGRWVTPGTWKKRVSSAGLGLCQGHDYNHSLGPAQETFLAGPGWNSVRPDGKSCISLPKHKWTDGPRQDIPAPFCPQCQTNVWAEPLKTKFVCNMFVRVHFLYCFRNCTMRGHPKKGRRLCFWVPHTFQASGEKTELLTGIRSIRGSSKLLLSCLISICPPEFGGLLLRTTSEFNSVSVQE